MYEVRFIWYTIYDIWYTIYDIRCTIYDIWYMIYDMINSAKTHNQSQNQNRDASFSAPCFWNTSHPTGVSWSLQFDFEPNDSCSHPDSVEYVSQVQELYHFIESTKIQCVYIDNYILRRRHCWQPHGCSYLPCNVADFTRHIWRIFLLVGFPIAIFDWREKPPGNLPYHQVR